MWASLEMEHSASLTLTLRLNWILIQRSWTKNSVCQSLEVEKEEGERKTLGKRSFAEENHMDQRRGGGTMSNTTVG